MNVFENYLIEERLDEMSTIVMDKKNSVLVQVNPDMGRMGLEYFKFFNSFSEAPVPSIYSSLYSLNAQNKAVNATLSLGKCLQLKT